jgi:hypothetical protein
MLRAKIFFGEPLRRASRFLASGYPLHHLHGFASLAVSVVPLLSLSQGAPSHHSATWCARALRTPKFYKFYKCCKSCFIYESKAKLKKVFFAKKAVKIKFTVIFVEFLLQMLYPLAF